MNSSVLKRILGAIVFLLGLGLAGLIAHSLYLHNFAETQIGFAIPAIVLSSACLFVGYRRMTDPTLADRPFRSLSLLDTSQSAVPCRRFRFGLRSLFMLVTMVAVGVAFTVRFPDVSLAMLVTFGSPSLGWAIGKPYGASPLVAILAFVLAMAVLIAVRPAIQ